MADVRADGINADVQIDRIKMLRSYLFRTRSVVVIEIKGDRSLLYCLMNNLRTIMKQAMKSMTFTKRPK